MSIFKLFRFILSALLTSFVLIGVALSITLEDEPLHALDWQPDVYLARDLFKKTADAAQQNLDLNFNQLEVNHALNSILNRYFNSNTQITFEPNNSANVDTSIKLTRVFMGKYLNIRFKLNNHDGGLRITHLKIGKLPLHPIIANFLINVTLQHSMLKHYYLLAKQHIQTIQIAHQAVNIHYQIDTLTTHYDTSSNHIDASILNFYQQQLEQIVSQHNPNQRLSLAELLQPLFKLAYERTTVENAIKENIAIIYAVSAYVNDNEIPFYVPIKTLHSSQYQYPVFLYKRTDQAKHFMLSATLTCTGGAQLADILGQEKELRDAQSSSGFSFIDIGADRAGMKFTEQAIRTPKEFQKNMAEIKDYSSFMPNVLDLPEKLTHAQFTRQFDSINSKAYKKLIQEIDTRIEALPIYPKKH